jgi:Mor family transcriptional regulator
LSVADELVDVVCKAAGLRDPAAINAVRQAIVRHFGGQDIYIPTRADLSKYALMVESRKSGASVRELARQFRVSETWVRRVLKRYGAR